MRIILVILIVIVTIVTLLLSLIIYQRQSEIKIEVFFIPSAFFILCFMVILIILSISQFKKESMWNKALLEATISVINQRKSNDNLFQNEYRDHRKQKLSYVLEIGKLKNKIERIKKEISLLKVEIKNGKLSENNVNIEETIKQKQYELKDNTTLCEEYDDHLIGINETLIELKMELNENIDNRNDCISIPRSMKSKT